MMLLEPQNRVITQDTKQVIV